MHEDRGHLPHHVYHLYGDSGALLYIGMTFDLKRRLSQHSWQSPWWSEVVRHTGMWCPHRERALAIERRAIMENRPKYNRVYNEDPTPVRDPASAPDPSSIKSPLTLAMRTHIKQHLQDSGYFDR